MVTKVLTLSEASSLTRLPENTLRYLRAQGRGPKSGKIGRRIMYRESDVTDWIDSQFEQTAG